MTKLAFEVPIRCVTFIFSEYIVRVTSAANPSFHENMNQTFTFYFSTLKDIYLYQCGCKLCACVYKCLCVCRDQKSASGDLYHSLPIEAESFPELGAHIFSTRLEASKPPAIPVSLFFFVSSYPNYWVICSYSPMPLFKIVLKLGLAIEPVLATM